MKRTEKDFIDWISQCVFYHGLDRYGQFSGNQVFASSYSSNEYLMNVVQNLDAGDFEAFENGDILKELSRNNLVWFDSDNDPELAMKKLMIKIRRYYFKVLNND